MTYHLFYLQNITISCMIFVCIFKARVYPTGILLMTVFNNRINCRRLLSAPPSRDKRERERENGKVVSDKGISE